jgi:predicted transcriptional regulator
METVSILPDTQYEIMKVIWSQPTPISSAQVGAFLKPHKNWKPQTVLTLLKRLTDRGFLSSERRGKDRVYTPLVTQEEYLRQATGTLVNKLHENSISGLMSALFADKNPTDQDLEELRNWMDEHGGRLS